MTLIEVMIALTIAAVALTAGAGTLGFLVDRQNQTGAQYIAGANATRSTLRDWIASAQLPTQGDVPFRGAASSHTLFDDPSAHDEITFLTSAVTPVASTGTIVRVFVPKDARGLFAELRPWREAGPTRTIALAPEALGLKLRYSDGHSWQREWITASVLPSAVRLQITFADTARGADSTQAARALLGIPVTVLVEARR